MDKGQAVTFRTGRLPVEDRVKLKSEREQIFGKNQYVQSFMRQERVYPQTPFLTGEDYAVNGKIRVRYEDREPGTPEWNHTGSSREGR